LKKFELLVPFYRFFPVVLGLVLMALYWQGMHGAFAFDDYVSFVNNQPIRAIDSTWASLLSAAKSGNAGPLGRPLSMATFALNYLLFGEAPLSFKFTNLAIHYANALMVMVLVRQMSALMLRVADQKRTAMLALCVSLLWALHPINAIPVLLVVQRMTSLSAFFMLSGLSLYIYGRSKKTTLTWCAIAISLLVCWPAAVYSKETGVLFPLYIFLCEALILGGFQCVSPKTQRFGALLAGVLFAVVCWFKWDIVSSGYRVRDFTLLERLLTESRVLWFYVQQIVWPMPHAFGLYHDDIILSHGLISPPSTMLAVVAWISITVVAYFCRKRWPFFALAVFWFLVSHVLESTILPLEIAHEHRNYLASIGLLLWVSNLALTFASTEKWRVPVVSSLLAFALFCALVTCLRSYQWKDDFNRRNVEVYNHPFSARANYEIAISLQERTFELGRGNQQAYDLIERHLEDAGRLDSNSKVAQVGLLYLNCIAGKPQNADVFANLLTRFSTQPFSYADRNLVNDLSVLLVNNKLCLLERDVQALLNAGLTNKLIDGQLRSAFNSVAMDYSIVRLQSTALAVVYARAAVSNSPNSVVYSSNLIHLLLERSQLEEAKSEYSRLSSLPVAAGNKVDMSTLKTLIESAEHHAPTR
jgi:hypothetical protein